MFEIVKEFWNGAAKKGISFQSREANEISSDAEEMPERIGDARDVTAAQTVKDHRRGALNFKQRVALGLAILVGVFLLYRSIWLTSFYGPYSLILSYLKERLPMADTWSLELLAGLGALFVCAHAGAIMSYVLFGKHKRLMLGLTLSCVVLNALIGWYSYGRVAVDEQGRVRVRVVERPDGSLKVIDRDFDAETGQRAHAATENDLVMLDLQRRGVKVRRVGMEGAFRSAQGTINVYYTRRDGRIILYNGPRHTDVSGDMPKATDEIIEAFKHQGR